MTEKKKAAIYARISAKDEKVPKTAQQIEQCRKLAAENGYEVVSIYEDDGISAFNGTDRAAYESMLEDIRAGNFDVILAVEESRFTRQGFGEKDRLMLACVAGGACWHTTREGFLDPATDSGEFMASLRGLLDNLEVKKKTRRQKDRYAEERAQGKPLWGGRPFGYQADRLTINEVEADAIRECIRRVLEKDATLYSCVRYLNDDLKLKTPRGNNWSTNTVKELLTRPRNAGIYIVNGEAMDVPGTWKPLIDRTTHEAVVATLKARSKSTPGRKPRHVGNMIIRCGVCGERMRSASDGHGIAIYRCKSKAVESHPDYKDGKRHCSIRVHFVEEVVKKEIVKAFFIGHNVLSASTSEGKELSSLYAKIEKLNNQKQDLLASIRGEDAVLTMADITPDLRAIKVALEAAEGQVEALTAEKAHARMLEEIRRSMGYLDSATHRVDWDKAEEMHNALSERYDALTLDTKRTLLDDLLEVTIGPGRGAKKVLVHHKVVTTLNSDGDLG
ncbi:recombinase family protein [Microbacterium sp. APC 3901]|uniref:recombinase family protein n=1 Tax=Microbacterium sp. APC 3901 TaxID=3035192 RepID=UPI0025B5A05D|nr:recombinase family protein [Microbacterium sp. APC 3901]MDN3443391.1 recombinase family protein [Microbacterium sp. APC 3901]